MESRAKFVDYLYLDERRTMMSNYVKELPKDAVKVSGAMCWITPNGELFGIETRIIPNRWNDNLVKHRHYGEYFRYQTYINKHNGYVYAPIKYIQEDGNYQVKQRRLHIIVAETFIPNPFNLPVVGHKNNIKSDIRVSNLYWTTFTENTQKAVDDGLMVNDKGYEDSQSMPVVMFNTYTNEEIGRYGSGREANKQTGIALNTILRQCKYKKPVRKPFYFRFQSDETVTLPKVVVQYDYYTDEEIGIYYNTNDASNKTGISNKTIAQQCSNNQKPKTVTKSKTYFLYKQ